MRPCMKTCLAIPGLSLWSLAFLCSKPPLSPVRPSHLWIWSHVGKQRGTGWEELPHTHTHAHYIWIILGYGREPQGLLLEESYPTRPEVQDGCTESLHLASLWQFRGKYLQNKTSTTIFNMFAINCQQHSHSDDVESRVFMAPNEVSNFPNVLQMLNQWPHASSILLSVFYTIL